MVLRESSAAAFTELSSSPMAGELTRVVAELFAEVDERLK